MIVHDCTLKIHFVGAGSVIHTKGSKTRHGACNKLSSPRASLRACGVGLLSSLIRFQNRQERFLRDFDLADLLHAFLAGGLLGPQFALAGDVAAIALGRHVLLDGSDGLASNNPAADGRLNSDLEQMPINFAAQFLDELAAT